MTVGQKTRENDWRAHSSALFWPTSADGFFFFWQLSFGVLFKAQANYFPFLEVRRTRETIQILPSPFPHNQIGRG